MRRAALLAALALLAACDTTSTPEVAPSNSPRIVTLAPHLAEILFAVGAGDRLVGVSAYSDYPAEVLELPLVGDAFTVDQEQLKLLRPDILLAWESGMPASTIDELRLAGYRVEVIRTRGLADIEAAIRRIGELADAGVAAEQLADEFRLRLRRLSGMGASAKPFAIFYQIAERPLYTVNGDHYISEILELCGAYNIFMDLDELAPSVDVEAVVARNPEVLAAAGNGSSLDVWKAFDTIDAVKHSRFLVLPADEIGRPGPRVLIAAEAACEALAGMRFQQSPP